MTIKIFTIFVLLVFPIALFANEYEIAQKMQTKFGEVQVVRQIHQVDPNDKDYGGDKYYLDPPSNIRLNGKIIFSGDTGGEYVHLLGVYNLKDGQAILISQNCGGSGCRIWPLSLIILRKDAPPLVITDDNFNSEIYRDEDLKPKEENGKIVIDLGYSKQKRKYATLENDKLYLSFVDEKITHLEGKVCQKLYDVSDVCVQPSYSKETCEVYAVDRQEFIGGNSYTWNRRWIAQHPGFNKKGYDQECLSACKTGKLNNYDVFKKNACVQP